MKLRLWILFVVVQTVGSVLPMFATHVSIAPLIFGFCLLLPGSVASVIFSNLPTWLLIGIIVGVNALVCWGVSKYGGKELMHC